MEILLAGTVRFQKCPQVFIINRKEASSKKTTTMKLLTLFGLILFINCTGQIQDKNSDFIELRDKLPLIVTPIVFNSNGETRINAVDLPNNKIIKELKNKNSFSTFGKIFETEDFITIIGFIPNDSGTPLLITIDKDGNELDSFVIYQTVGFDMGYYRSNFVTINADKSITLIDSLITRKINENRSGEIPDTDSLTVNKINYRITNKGKIEIIE
jgi:hypothetical protein